MKYEYEGILCGVDDSILNLKYEDIYFVKEELDVIEFKTKYGNFYFDNFYGGMYQYRDDDKYEIILIKMTMTKQELDDKELTLDYDIEQEMHSKIDFFLSFMNTITDSYLYVISPKIQVTNINDGNNNMHIFPYEMPISSFLINSQYFREKKQFSKYNTEWLVDKFNFIKENDIFKTVSYYYNSHKMIHDRPVQFTTLMTCLEILLIEGKGELADKISRNIAVIFSKDKEDGIKIYKKIKYLYNIRSKIVHEGNFDTSKYYRKYQKNAYFELEKIVFNVIFLFINNKFIKLELIEELQSMGYGDFYNKYRSQNLEEILKNVY